MSRKDIKKINSELRKFNDYFDEIPLNEISEVLNSFGIKLLQEDGTEFSGILCGNNSYTTIEIGKDIIEELDNLIIYEIIKNTFLYISWYKMSSGRYEIVTYLT